MRAAAVVDMVYADHETGLAAAAKAAGVPLADGIDVAGLVAVEAVLAEDPLGYLDGVAASVRRWDATLWVERWAEAVGEALVRQVLDGLEARLMLTVDEREKLL